MKKLYFLAPLLLLIISCSKPIDEESLVQRNGVYYKVNSETPYSGKFFSSHDNGQRKSEGNYKDGKIDGMFTTWHKNGQKKYERNWSNGNLFKKT